MSTLLAIGLANAIMLEAGLSFLGLQWLYKRKSSFFYGLEEDATHLAEHIAART